MVGNLVELTDSTAAVALQDFWSGDTELSRTELIALVCRVYGIRSSAGDGWRSSEPEDWALATETELIGLLETAG